MGSGEGGGILQWLSKGAGGIIMGRGMHECINNSHMLQLSALAIACFVVVGHGVET